MKPRVSVIVPTYNGSRFIRETVESVLAQTYADTEVLICDDGSTDDTVQILSSFGSKIRTLEQANAGVSAARNRAAREASGSLLAFLDQDDLWEPNMLEEQVARLNADQELGFVYSDSRIIDTNGANRGRRGSYLDYRAGSAFGALIAGNFVPIETLVMRAELFRELGGFRTDLSYLEDFDLCLRAARRRPIGFNPSVLARYRVHDSNLSHATDDILLEYSRLLDELSNDSQLPTELCAVVERERRRRHAELAWSALRRVDVKSADAWLAREPVPTRPLKVTLLRMLSRVLPTAATRRVVGLFPRHKLYGVRVDWRLSRAR